VRLCPFGILAPLPQRAAGEPGRDQDRVQEAPGGDDCHQRRQQRPARLEHELVADVLDGVEADQRQQKRGCDDAGDRGLAQRASDIDARGGR
jgi:hypothetical protein